MGYAIEVNNLTKQFGLFKAVNDISFKVKKGEIFGFLGANGAGKTTAIKMLTGLSIPTAGEASVAGFDVYTQTQQIRKKIGYMSQKFSLYDDLTIKENIQFFGGIYGLSKKVIKRKSEELLKTMGLEDKAKMMTGELPLGWKQKIAFSIAMLHEPAILFLDEPTGGVDPITRRQFWELIYQAAEKGFTIFVTTHYMDEAEYCDRVSIMVDGIIADLDTPRNLKEKHHAQTMDDVFVKLARGAEAIG